jgi:hypothetical protein
MDLLINENGVVSTIKKHSVFNDLPNTWMEREYVTPQIIILGNLEKNSKVKKNSYVLKQVVK